MNDSTQKLSTLFAIILVSSSLFLILGKFKKLDSTRPSQSTGEPYPGMGSQTVPARLWQDPFESLKTLTNSQGHAQALAYTNAIILAVMLEGTPYPEDVEVRRRLRYAVEIALLTSGLTPEDRSHIGVDRLSLTNITFDSTPPSLELAFEWFTRKAGQRVLLLWLKEDDFASSPLRNLAIMLKALGEEGDQPNVYLIGPRSSNTLKAMAEESTSGLPASSLASRLHIFSPEATAPDWALFQDATGFYGRDWLRNERFGTASGRGEFQNWIATDDTLCSNLVAELINRRVGPDLEAGERIVLISEADTFYGRLLPRVFESALTNRCGPDATNHIWRFSYLRGLEGIKAQTADEEDKRKAATSPEALLQAALERSGEQAEGEAQNDYARRLAEFLSAKDRQLRRTYGRIRAVGLTGSDVYDKLLLLQALRPELPDAIFFTTDLDARFWMPPEQTRQTRNLLVASSYPLDPVLPSQQFLPFRDVYQTAVFAACQGAVRHMEGDSAVEPPQLTGAVYEIGRHGAVLLVPPGSDAEPRNDLESAGGRTGVMASIPAEIRYTFASSIASLGVLLLSIILLGGFHRAETRRAAQQKPGPQAKVEPGELDDYSESRPPWQMFGWAALTVVFVLAVWLVAGWISSQPGEETWSFSDGISIWPTQGLRLLALTLSIAFIVIAGRRHENHRNRLWRCFFSTGGDAEPPRAVPFLISLRTWLRHCLPAPSGAQKSLNDIPKRLGLWFISLWKCSPDPPSIRINNWRVPMADKVHVDASQLFLDYCHMGSRRFRHARAWIMAGSYTMIAALCVFLTGGVPDRLCVRGLNSFRFDTALLVFSIVGFLLVLFYTLDAARLAGKMLKHIARPTVWPAWLLRKWAREKCVREQDLDGWLDVQFAVEKTRETGRLLIYPFVVFLLLLLARHNYFDNWSWPASLILIFGFNFLLAAACWWFVRQSARHVKRRAMTSLQNTIHQIANGKEESIRTPAPVDNDSPGATGKSVSVYTREAYARRLIEFRKEIEDEKRAAFAHWIQDPTYLALFIPTGVTGLLTILLGRWLSLG